MPTTINRTLPNDWQPNITYHEGDLVVYAAIMYRCLQTSTNNRPDTSKEYWTPLDIYVRDSTVMESGDYSGDEEFWNRDNIYIDSAGWVYVNNENTGINVRGPEGQLNVQFESLTPSQLEQIRGPQGLMGPQGPVGPQGPQGPMGEVQLTPEQVSALKGADGKSTYEIWLEEGHTGTTADFLAWVRDGQMFIDDHLDVNSVNPVQNKVITENLQSFRTNYSERLTDIAARLTQLENRLKYSYQGEDKLFRFGISSEGKYGYFYNNSETLIPFDHINTEHLISNQTEINDGNFNSRIAEEGILQQDTPNLITGVISEPATAVNMADFFPSYRVYIYKDGVFTDELPHFGYSLYHMNYSISTPLVNLTSYGQHISEYSNYFGEGIVIPPSAFDNQPYSITFVIKVNHNIELQEGQIETLSGNICTFTDSAVLPTSEMDIQSAEPPTKYTKFENWYHTSEQDPDALVYIPFYVNANEGVFLASLRNFIVAGGNTWDNITNPATYQIKEIYLGAY